ncbi:MAG: CRISPR-associated protein Cmr2 [Nodularia sp. (in: Bacteria)]|nr:MAG: CRISPR-associated protein Cmr2 [Nodularia sp. (in: cyanobacteria)]
MTKYTAITFAPVQGFIEKSRKLRDLYGASLILSYLSQQIVQAAKTLPEVCVISPASINVQQGMPNRILIKGEFSKEKAQEVLLNAWKDILDICENWIQRNLPEFQPYKWEREWKNWGNYTWEIFWGSGDSILDAMEDLETRKLSRDWTALNWIGESSSLTGTDGIAFPELGGEKRNPKNLTYRSENSEINKFYTRLAEITEENSEENPVGKFISPNEKLSIPELVKRLVTRAEIADDISQKRKNNPPFEKLSKGFKEIQRKATTTTPGRWTGWFMGDGDKVGIKLKEIAREQGEAGLKQFTYALRNWGQKFYENSEQENSLERVIYAGGDDFLGVIYSKNPHHPILGITAFDWLTTLPKKWQEHGQDINLSVGFVWVAGSVPQRDILQHCRQAEKRAKNLNRNRVTIRIVFNSGQYIDWTCPWEYLHILKQYCDRDQKTYSQPQDSNYDKNQLPNWTHIYSDLAQLKSRHAFGLAENHRQINVASEVIDGAKIIKNRQALLTFFDIYFPNWGEILKKNEKYLIGATDDVSNVQKAQWMINWIENLITVGWYLCSDTSSSSDH